MASYFLAHMEVLIPYKLTIVIDSKKIRDVDGVADLISYKVIGFFKVKRSNGCRFFRTSLPTLPIGSTSNGVSVKSKNGLFIKMKAN